MSEFNICVHTYLKSICVTLWRFYRHHCIVWEEENALHISALFSHRQSEVQKVNTGAAECARKVSSVHFQRGDENEGLIRRLKR